MIYYYRCAVFCISALLCTSSVRAQEPRDPVPTLDPAGLEFDPSPDHSLWHPNGDAIVSRYELQFYYVGGAQPFQVTNLGKPAPEADGKIRVPFLGYISEWPPSGIIYEARVSSIGVSGTGESAPSNLFMYSTGPCEYMVNPSMTIRDLTIPASGGAGQTPVLTGVTCAWQATSSAAWLTVTSGYTTGNGMVKFTAASNSGGHRMATITVGTSSVVVSQAGFGTSPEVQLRRNTSVTPTPETDTIVPGSSPTDVSIGSGPVATPSAVKQATAVSRSNSVQPDFADHGQSFKSSFPEGKPNSRVAPLPITSKARGVPIHGAPPDTSSGVQPVANVPVREMPTVAKQPVGETVAGLAISAATVAPGAAVTVSVPAGFAHRGGWLGLYASATDSAEPYARMQYVEQTTGAEAGAPRTLTFTMPTICGDYTFRFFAGDSLIVAASGGITVADPIARR